MLGTVTFLWFWEEQPKVESESNEPDISEEPVNRVSPADKSTLDNTNFDAGPKVNYNIITERLYGNDNIETPPDEQTDIKRIEEEEFNNLSSAGNYDLKSYTLYSDDILADSTSDDIISESDAFVALGPNYTSKKLRRIFSLASDGSDVLDVIFIRNDRLYTLYEIMVDDRTYREVTGR